MAAAKTYTPSELSMRGRIGAHAKWAKNDPVEGTASARSASPGSLSYFERQVDPDGVLLPAERLRRAESARKAYFTRLALKSSLARKKRTAS